MTPRKILIVTLVSLLSLLGIGAVVLGLFSYYTEFIPIGGSIALMVIGGVIILALISSAIIWWLVAYRDE